MKKKIIIICYRYLTYNGTELSIGGSETYFRNLAEVCKENGYEVVIMQPMKSFFLKKIDDVKVIGYSNTKERHRILKDEFIEGNSLIVYSDFYSVGREKYNPSIVINHGVYWDFAVIKLGNFLDRLLILKRIIDPIFKVIWILNKIKKVDKIITVDTNLQNWLRIQCRWLDIDNKFVYIPNFSDVLPQERITEKLNKKNVQVVLFARRFTFFRGTYLWTNVVQRLAERYPNIEFRFVGEGDKTSERYIRDRLKNMNNVRIHRSSPENIINEHYEADIEVIPSIGSEGTSFSAIEAMAAGCAVVASNIGGLGNIIIPGYNGIIVQPTEDNFEREVTRLIENPQLARELGRRAYDVVKIALNKERWEKQILEVIRRLI